MGKQMTDEEVLYWLEAYAQIFGEDKYEELVHQNNMDVISRYAKKAKGKGRSVKIPIRELMQSAAEEAIRQLENTTFLCEGGQL